MLVDERRFNQAVELAGAFVANGDLRLAGGSTRPDQNSMEQLRDLIETLYDTLERAHEQLIGRPG